MNPTKLCNLWFRPGLISAAQSPRKRPFKSSYFAVKPLSDSIVLITAVIWYHWDRLIFQYFCQVYCFMQHHAKGSRTDLSASQKQQFLAKKETDVIIMVTSCLQTDEYELSSFSLSQGVHFCAFDEKKSVKLWFNFLHSTLFCQDLVSSKRKSKLNHPSWTFPLFE